MISKPKYEKIATGFWEAKAGGGRIHIIRTSFDTRNVVDLFYERSAQFVDTCRQNGWPVLYLHEIGSLGFSSYSRKKARDFMINYHDMVGRGAYVFQRTAQTTIARGYILNTLQKAWKQLEIKEFPEIDDAVAWLAEKIDPSALND